MNKHLYACVLVVALLMSGVTGLTCLSNGVRAQGNKTVTAQESDPILNNTDYNDTIGQTSPNLNMTIAPRTIIEYGDYAITQSLNSSIPPLQISPRTIMEYTDAASQLALQSPQGLNDTEVTPRIVVEYADYASFIGFPLQPYAGPDIPEAHDVAVTNVTSSKTGCLPMPTIGQGVSISINVTVANQGSYTEIVNTTAYANATIIGSENITLPVGDSATVTFTWNTTDFAYGNYTLSAYALLPPGETNTANNNMSGGTVYVGIPGDLNGDGTVDIYDAIILAKAFNSTPGDNNWNPNADINGDGIVDIYDAIILAGHFNQQIS